MTRPMRVRLLRPFLVLVLSLTLTGLTVRYSLVNAATRDLGRFSNRVQRTEDLIRSRLDTYVVLLQSWAFQFASGTPVRPIDCLALIRRMDLERGYPGIARLGFSLRVRSGDEESLSKWLAAIGQTEGSLPPRPDTGESYPILILEPRDPTLPFLGFDASSIPSLRAAMDRARDEGVPAASAEVDLRLGHAPRDEGFMIFVPVYRTGLVPESLADRREALEGFVHGSFRMEGLLSHLIQGEGHGVGFDIYPSEAAAGDQPLYSSFGAKERLPSPVFESSSPLEVAGKTWTIRYRTIRPFSDGSEKGQALIVLLLGISAGGALFGLAISQERTAATLRSSEEHIRMLNLSLENRVRERTAELEAANKALEAFSYSASHDLRGPLRSLDGFSQLLLDRYGPGLDDQGRNYIQRVLLAAKEMSLLIDGFLALARVTRREMKEERVDLSALATGICEGLRSRMPDRRVQCLIQPGIAAKGDPQLLRIALDNLIQNAWKFTLKRSDPVISFGAGIREGEAFAFVRDNGEGFDMSRADRLFKPFERLHKTEDFPGSGIGLATVQRVIDRHSGRVWAQSSPGQGATFYFTLRGGIEIDSPTDARPSNDDAVKEKAV